MAAQFNSETFASTSHTPEPIASDPDDVRLAFETARAFQGMGEIGDAAEWLERAAERAAQVGQHDRAVVLLQAIAELTKRSAPSRRLAAAPSSSRSDVRDRGSVRPPPAKLPPCRHRSTQACRLCGRSREPRRSPPSPAPCRKKTIRAAVAGLVPEFGSFTIEQLAKGQPLPAGTREATLTLSEDERTIEVVIS
jgi:hypothetical protein